ncbi:hypothetical protein GCM10009128_00030 [Psychrosphaera haliotis]
MYVWPKITAKLGPGVAAPKKQTNAKDNHSYKFILTPLKWDFPTETSAYIVNTGKKSSKSIRKTTQNSKKVLAL